MCDFDHCVEMAALYYDPYGRRSSSYAVTPIQSYSSSYDSRSRTPAGSSVISGIKSMFCSKKASASISSSQRFDSSLGKSFSGTHKNHSSPSYVATTHNHISHVPSYPRRDLVRIKTSDSFPIISSQLEDRMLQLADRSRRLGVHRYSRTRNALILNQHTSTQRLNQQPPTLDCFARAGSSTSLSTQSSISSTTLSYRKGSVSLPGLSACVRE